MASWTRWQENFSGSLDVKASLAALGKIFRSTDPRVDAIKVPGELVVDVNAPRVTRSQKKASDTWYFQFSNTLFCFNIAYLGL